MATHRISILQAVQPDNTGRCWVEPYDIAATNDIWKHGVIRLANPATNNHGWYGIFEVPQNYVSAAAFKLNWTTTAITGNAAFRLTYRIVTGSNTTSLDQTSQTEQVSSTTNAAPGAAHRKMDATLAVTAANFSAGALVEYLIERFDSASNDTCAADITVHNASFEYADV